MYIYYKIFFPISYNFISFLEFIKNTPCGTIIRITFIRFVHLFKENGPVLFFSYLLLQKLFFFFFRKFFRGEKSEPGTFGKLFPLPHTSLGFT